MKKIISLILTVLLTLSALALTACGGKASFAQPTLTTPGEIKSVKGFIAESENYLYFINGVGSFESDNKFGAPVKGSLVAVEKSTLGTEDEKMEVIVPKLFIAEDYTAGLFFKDGYVYYGTPSTDKNSDGEIARENLTFYKTSLDSKKTKKFITVSTLATKYRFIQVGEDLCIVYLDEETAELKSYNTVNGKETLIAKNDEKTSVLVDIDGDEKDDGYLSLDKDTVLFTEDKVVFTQTVYVEDYVEEKTSRNTAKYNLMYVYDSDGLKVLGNGKKDTIKYATNFYKDGYLFFKTTDIYSKEINYGIANADILEEGKTASKIVNDKNLARTNVIISLEEVYFIDSSAKTINKTTLVGNETNVRRKIASSENVSTMLYVYESDLYYYDIDKKLAKMPIDQKNGNAVRLSEDTVLTTWYNPAIIELGETAYIFYIDNTTVGANYVKYVDVNGEVLEKDLDDNDTIDVYYVEGQKDLSIMLDVDKAKKITAAIDAIPDVLAFTEKDGVLVCEEVENAVELYENNESLKEYVSSENISKLDNAKRALKLANYYYELKENYSKLNDDETKKAEFKTNEDVKQSFANAVNFRNELASLDENGEIYTKVRDMIPDEYKYYFQEAEKLLG